MTEIKTVKYAKDSLKTALNEYTRAGREFMNKTGRSAGENTNPEIERKGWDYLKEHVERDTHYRSVIDTRINSLIANGFKIMPAQTIVKGRIVISPEDQMMADFITDCLERMSGCFEQDIIAMMTDISRGFSLSEINYQYIERGAYSGKVGLKNIRYKEPELFSFKFDELGYFSLKQIDPEQTDLDIRKYVHFINGFNDENPYGDSFGAMCAFWVWLKENEAKFWAIFSERFGQPFVSLEVPDNMQEDSPEAKIADKIINNIHSSSGMQIPKGMVLKYLEAIRTGEANYRGFIDTCNQEMSKMILGSTLAVETQKNSSGTHAAANTHENTMGIQKDFDVIKSMSAINQQLIKPLIDYNFVNVDKYPKFMWKTFDVSAFISFAQGIEALLRCGKKIPENWVNEITTIPYPMDGEDVLVYNPGAGIYPPDAKGIDNKVLNHKGTEARRMDFMDRYGRDGLYARNMIVPNTVRYAQSAEEKTAKAEDRKNTAIMNQGKDEIIRRWESFAESVAKSKKFDAYMLSEFERNEIAGIMSQFLLISTLRGLISGNEETGVLDSFNAKGAKDAKTQRGLLGWLFRDTETRRRGESITNYELRIKQEQASCSTTIKFAEGSLYQPFEDILKRYRELNLISLDEYKALEKEMQMQAFTVSGNDSNYILSVIHDELMEVLLGGADLPDFYDRVVGIFERAGVIGTGGHIETVLRTNLQTHYINGRDRVFAQTDATEFPYKQVVAVMDSATRPEHARLNKYTKGRLDPVWSWLKPPFDYNCRCTIRMVHRSEAVQESDWIPDRSAYGLL